MAKTNLTTDLANSPREALRKYAAASLAALLVIALFPVAPARAATIETGAVSPDDEVAAPLLAEQVAQAAAEEASELRAQADSERAKYGSIPYTEPAKSIHDANEVKGLAPQSALPASYSSVDEGHVSSVADQGSFGTCWAFATAAAIEASMLAHGQATEADLSERHIAYFTYHATPDPLRNTVGDFTKATSSNYGTSGVSDLYLGNGGNSWIAANTLATWQGAVNEDAVGTYENLLQAYRDAEAFLGGDNYESFLDETALKAEDAYARDSVHLTGTAQIPLADADDVKRAIVSHGAATIQISFNEDSYYNFMTHAYYDPYDTTVNHDVTIVGWDDNYSRDNFLGEEAENPELSPSEDGAWLVKNSWGTYWGDGGYFWLSYEDACLNDDSAQAFIFDVDSADNYANIYQYDGSASTTWNYIDSGGSIANIYTAKANPSGSEKVEAVSFALSDVNVNYSIQVYSNVSSSANPTSGTAMLASPVKGTTSYMGYYTVKLPNPVQVAENTKYSVVITLSHKDGSEIAYGAGASYDASWVSYTEAVQAGQSFERNSARASWGDLATKAPDAGDEPASCARIKAFTSNAGKFVPVKSDTTTTKAKTSIARAKVSVAKASAYTGRALKPAVVVTLAGKKLVAGTDYSVTYSNNVKAGKATVKVTGKGAYTGTATGSFNIAKAANPMNVAGKTASVKYSKKKARKVAASMAYRFTAKAQGAVTYSRVAKGSSKWLTVNAKTGVVTVKKRAPKKTQKIVVRVSAAGNANYQALSKTVTVKVKVKVKK